MPKRIEDEVFITTWRNLGSATAVARTLGLDVRAVNKRRRNLERLHGIALQGTDPRSPDYEVVIPENGVRTRMTIEDGIGIVFSDAHYWPGIKSTAHRALVAAVRELKPKFVVCNGDAFDGASISRHPANGWEVKPNVKQELAACEERLNEVEAVAGNATLLWRWGNHDIRFNARLASHAAQFEGVRGFSLADHFLRWKFGMSLMINDSVMVKHRWHNGIHCSYNNTLKSGTSIVCGHTHSLKVTPYTDYKGTRYGVDTGTLAEVQGPQFGYAEDAPANHRSGFAVLTFYKGQLLPPELLEVIDEDTGLVSFRGQVVQV